MNLSVCVAIAYYVIRMKVGPAGDGGGEGREDRSIEAVLLSRSKVRGFVSKTRSHTPLL